MFCKNCGTKIVDGAKFCQSCGCPNENKSNSIESGIINQPEFDNIETPVINKQSQQNINSGMGQHQVQTNSIVNQEQKNKKDIILFAILAIIGIAVIATAIVIGMKNEKADNNLNSNSNNNSNINSNDNSDNGQIEYGGFIFEIPEEYSATIDSDGLTITDEDWFVMLEVQSGYFDSFKKETDYLENYMSESGYEVGVVKLTTYGEVEYMTAEISQSNMKMILGYAKLDSSHIAVIVVSNYNYTIDYSLLTELAPIIKSAKSK